MSDKTIVYVLGAGASAGASETNGAPVMNKLTCRAFWLFGGKMEGSERQLMGPMRGDRGISSFKEAFKLIDCLCGTSLSKQLEKQYETAVTPVNVQLDIEALFTKMDNISKGNEPYPASYDRKTFEKVSGDVSLFFYHTLCHETAQTRPVYYSAFADLALKPGKKHCIITFNYDMLLERAMCNLYINISDHKKNPLFNRKYYSPERLPWTYDIPFAQIFCGEPYRIGDDIDIIHYLKLHGSFNWGLCPETKEITMYSPVCDPYAYQRFHNGVNTCHGAKHKQESLLIPPVREKDISVPGIRDVWVKARSFLNEASEVHMIGYSLPDADKGAHELFSETLRHKIERVVLVNPDKGHRDKFKKLIGKNSSSCQEYDCFSDYLRNEYCKDLSVYIYNESLFVY